MLKINTTYTTRCGETVTIVKEFKDAKSEYVFESADGVSYKADGESYYHDLDDVVDFTEISDEENNNDNA